MAGRILITHPSPKATVPLGEALAAEGCDVFQAETLESAELLLRHRPDLMLLDTHLAKQAKAEQLSTLATQLELAETFCLRLCPAAEDYSEARSLTPFACGTISAPWSTEQVVEQINTLLRIKQAETERNQAQERLLLHQMEVDEGLRSAAQIQHALLPSNISQGSAFDFAWQFIPCETVGGDLFNILPLSDKLSNILPGSRFLSIVCF